eukprot:COSAG05_NODE_25383_length_197_cov_52.204082_1_plen_33_part_10
MGSLNGSDSVVGDENPEHSGKSGSEQKSSSNRT